MNCKYVKREGESCTRNNKCTYPNCSTMNNFHKLIYRTVKVSDLKSGDYIAYHTGQGFISTHFSNSAELNEDFISKNKIDKEEIYEPLSNVHVFTEDELSIKNVDAFYKDWCKETKRNGGILIGSSIKECLNDFVSKLKSHQ